jgi:uncharacterized membrane protein
MSPDDKTIVSTTLMTLDNQKVVLPNNMIWGDVGRQRQETGKSIMSEAVVSLVEGAGIFLSLCSVAAIVVGLPVAFGSYLRHFRKLSPEESYRNFKPRLAKVLMVALEILVVADVIETITVKITLESLATLGLLVIVRTWLSWTLALEAEGRWPWQPELKE